MSTLHKTISRLFRRGSHFKNAFLTRNKPIAVTYFLPVLYTLTGSITCYIIWRLYGNKGFDIRHMQTIEQSTIGKLSQRQKRFIKFASVQYRGQLYMTPRDFLESVIQANPRPRLKRKALTDEDLIDIIESTPHVGKSSKTIFHDTGDNGIISYSEYLFMLSVLIEPPSAFHVAFNMFDTDYDGRIDKNEFLVIEKIFNEACKRKAGNMNDPNGKCADEVEGLKMRPDISTTLQLYFFGPQGNYKVQFKQFKEFMSNLQDELIQIEFYEISKGMPTISEVDFGNSLLRYSYLDITDDDMLTRVHNLLERVQPNRGVTLAEFKKFYLLLNHLEDFAIALRMTTRAKFPLTETEFQRIVKTITGSPFSPHMVKVIYAIFDKDGDGLLTYQELIATLKDRLHRGIRGSKKNMWSRFKKCVRHDLKHTL